MKKTFVILAITMVVISTVTSCVSSRAGRGGGCKMTQGYIGYGGGR